MAETFSDPIEEEIRNYVLTRARLGIYDPLQPRRARVEVRSFAIEFLERDEQSPVVHAAGPVVLAAPAGDLAQFLRVTVTLNDEGRIAEDADVRAAYIVETDPETGACKETAALANA